ncbi:hypothetical protein, partial [Pseudomonas sp. FW306-2-11AA]|uniref:hypothetical protein n=1 Tax=Pseudomonas sp. FW306-2-11AA TaxID=2070663 RepID=UPI001C440555
GNALDHETLSERLRAPLEPAGIPARGASGRRPGFAPVAAEVAGGNTRLIREIAPRIRANGAVLAARRPRRADHPARLQVWPPQN